MLGPSRLINFRVGAGHIGARMLVLGDKGFLLPTGPGRGPASPAEAKEIAAVVERELQAGGVAVGIGIPYTPGVAVEEIAAIVDVAARHGAFLHAHLAGGMAGLKTALGVTGKAGVPLHIAHVYSTGGSEVRSWLDTIQDARKRGADVTTEMYPYTAGATMIQSALYDGWENGRMSDSRRCSGRRPASA